MTALPLRRLIFTSRCQHEPAIIRQIPRALSTQRRNDYYQDDDYGDDDNNDNESPND